MYTRKMRRVVVLTVLALSAVSVPALTTSAMANAGDEPSPNAIVEAGLAAWRAPNERGIACAGCHGPDGFEIARFGFGDDALLPRDRLHTPPADADRIVAMVHAVRDKYDLNERLLDPIGDRLLQPGGRLVAGTTSTERDYNAALHTFVPQLPTLFTGRVDSVLKALQAREELLAFDPRAQALGVPVPQLSRRSAAGWLTEWPRLPRPGSESKWYALHDAYLANPSEANLWAIYNAVESLTAALPDAGERADALSAAKYRSLLLAQHLMRERALGAAAPSAMFERRPIAFLEIPAEENRLTRVHSPMFVVGNLIYRAQGADAAAEALPWWFAAWTFNPGLPDVTDGRADFLAALEGRIGGDPYPIHHQFVRIKMDMTQAYAPYVRLSGRPPQVNALELGDAARGFVYADDEAGTMFFNQAHRALYHIFSANVRRMQLYLLVHEFNKQCADDRSYVSLVGDEVAFVERLHAELLPDLERAQPQYAAKDRALVMEAIRRLQEAWNRCRPLPPVGGGQGLYVERYVSAVARHAYIAARPDRIGAMAAPGSDDVVFARWSGEIEPRFSDVYQLFVRRDRHADVGFRLWIDEQLLIDCWEGSLVAGRVVVWGGDHHCGADVLLKAGRRHAIRLEHRRRGGTPSFQLIWKSAQQWPEVIPQSQLYPVVEPGREVLAIAKKTR